MVIIMMALSLDFYTFIGPDLQLAIGGNHDVPVSHYGI